MWTPEGIRPIVTVTGSHQRTCVFGTITIDGKQLFRQYDVFNQYVFLKYLEELQRKFRKLLLFIDRAGQHRNSIMVRKHLEENKDVIKVEYLPKGSSEYNAVEECWRQGKEAMVSFIYSNSRRSNWRSNCGSYGLSVECFKPFETQGIKCRDCLLSQDCQNFL